MLQAQTLLPSWVLEKSTGKHKSETQLFFNPKLKKKSVLIDQRVSHQVITFDLESRPNQGCQILLVQQTKNTSLGNFGWCCDGRRWYILWPFGLFYCHLAYCKAFWYILRYVIWYILHVLVRCSKKNLATLVRTRQLSGI
jgi:hypothetical protein